MSFFKRLLSRPKKREAQAAKEKAKQEREALKKNVPGWKNKLSRIVERQQKGEIKSLKEDLDTLGRNFGHPLLKGKYGNTRQKIDSLLRQIGEDSALLENGFPLPPKAAAPAYTPEPGTLFYVAQSCIPLRTNGYAIRTHQILKALRQEGWNAIGITRAGFPLIEAAYRERIASEGMEAVLASLPPSPAFEHDGVPYLYRPDPDFPHGSTGTFQIQATAEWIVEQARQHRPALLHAASNFANGLAALIAGRQLGIPVVYEIRGLWELTKASQNPGYSRSERFALQARLEAQATLHVDGLFAITTGVADTLAERGVPRDRFTILSNAVDPSGFEPRLRDPELEARYDTAGKLVIGYGGSITAYEGLEMLLQAASELPDELRRQIKLLMVGGGPHLEALQTAAAPFRKQLDIVFTGRVPFEEMARHYSLFDIAPLPRLRSELTETVSPIKPFELMAMEKALIVSDVKALADIVTHDQTGLLHAADDPASLRAGLERLIRDPALRQRLGTTGRQWVISECTWAASARLIGRTYERLGARAGK